MLSRSLPTMVIGEEPLSAQSAARFWGTPGDIKAMLSTMKGSTEQGPTIRQLSEKTRIIALTDRSRPRDLVILEGDGRYGLGR